MQETILKNKKVHFIGICGLGMSALAIMLKDMGAIVTGSDEGFYDPAFSYLKKNDITILSPHKKENIPKNIDLIVIGRHAKLNPEENEEVRLALETPKKIKSFPEVLSDITQTRENIVVAGSYGKSTCTALLTYCLLENDIETGYFLGALTDDLEDSAQIGKDRYFILEGDEYPAYGGVSKFLYLHPKNILLTSAEHDHINVFPTIESYLKPYKELMHLLPEDGLLVAGINNPNVKEVIKENKAKLVTYGMNNTAQYYPQNIKYGAITTFDLYKNEEKIVELHTKMLGIHNIENIVGVSAFILEKNILNKERLANTIAEFNGLKRRLDLKTKKSSLLVYEGFGSSYTKAKTVIDAIKLHFPNKKIITIFEPHTFSWRNKNTLYWYDDIFKDSDETIILPPPEHGKNAHDQVSLEEILEKVKKNKENVYGAKDKESVIEILEKIVQKDDLIILMSSGEMYGLVTEVPHWAENKFPKN